MFTAVKMLMVFALLGGTLYYLKRHDRGAVASARRGDKPVAVVASAKVGKTASVAVVRIGGDTWAVGVTEQSVSLLVPEPVELDLPAPRIAADDADDAADGYDDRASRPSASPSGLPTGLPTGPPTVRAFVGGLLARRRSVQYLDVELPPRAADGSARTPTARMPEQSAPR